jgi:hypothetical protein
MTLTGKSGARFIELYEATSTDNTFLQLKGIIQRFPLLNIFLDTTFKLWRYVSAVLT